MLVTFTLAIITIFALDLFHKHKGFFSGCLAVLVFGAVVYACCFLPARLPGFDVDYGVLGVMLPVVVFLVPDKIGKVFAAAVVLIAMCGSLGDIQWYGLLALPLLLFYNERRGKANLKYMFYIFYPVHLAAIYLIGLLLKIPVNL